jgi:hypothetical protein
VQPPGLAAELALGEVDGRRQRGRLLVGVGVGELAREGVPLAVGRDAAERVDGLAGEGAEAIAVEGAREVPTIR